MILTIKNQVAGTRSYLGGLITVAESGQTTIAREFNVLLIGDAQFLSDLGANGPVNVVLNNGVKDLNAGEALTLAQTLAHFTTDPLATAPIYYSAPVGIRQSDTTETGAVVWAMRNPAASPYVLAIERIFLSVSFGSTTPLTGVNTQRYELVRFSAATPSGGTQLTPVRASTLAPASAVDVRFLDTGLTVVGVSFEPNAFAGIACPEIAGAVSPFVRDKCALLLRPGEGLAICVSEVSAAVGQGLHGEIVWSLR